MQAYPDGLIAVEKAAVNASLGYDPAVVALPHPIQDRTDSEMRALADQAFDAILRAVSGTV